MGFVDFILKNITKKQNDFDTIESIKSIKIPKYHKINGLESPVNNIEYILQRKATQHKKAGKMDLAIECLRKSNEIIPYSNFQYSMSDYLRLCSYLELEKRYDESMIELNIFEQRQLSDNDRMRLYAHYSSYYKKTKNPYKSSYYELISTLYRYKNDCYLLKTAYTKEEKQSIKDCMVNTKIELKTLLTKHHVLVKNHTKILNDFKTGILDYQNIYQAIKQEPY